MSGGDLNASPSLLGMGLLHFSPHCYSHSLMKLWFCWCLIHSCCFLFLTNTCPAWTCERQVKAIRLDLGQNVFRQWTEIGLFGLLKLCCSHVCIYSIFLLFLVGIQHAFFFIYLVPYACFCDCRHCRKSYLKKNVVGIRTSIICSEKLFKLNDFKTH